MRPRTDGTRPAGFTLLETLVALVILALGVTGVLQLLGGSARSAVRVRTATEATFVAEAMMEEIIALDEETLLSRSRGAGRFAGLTLSTSGSGRRRSWPGAADSEGADSDYAYALSVTPDRVQPGLYRVDLEVTWERPAPGRLELTTLRHYEPMAPGAPAGVAP